MHPCTDMGTHYCWVSSLHKLTKHSDHIQEIQRLIGQKSQIWPTPILFRALVWGDPLRIYGKVLWFLKLEPSSQPMVKIW